MTRSAGSSLEARKGSRSSCSTRRYSPVARACVTMAADTSTPSIAPACASHHARAQARAAAQVQHQRVGPPGVHQRLQQHLVAAVAQHLGQVLLEVVRHTGRTGSRHRRAVAAPASCRPAPRPGRSGAGTRRPPGPWRARSCARPPPAGGPAAAGPRGRSRPRPTPSSSCSARSTDARAAASRPSRSWMWASASQACAVPAPLVQPLLQRPPRASGQCPSAFSDRPSASQASGCSGSAATAGSSMGHRLAPTAPAGTSVTPRLAWIDGRPGASASAAAKLSRAASSRPASKCAVPSKNRLPGRGPADRCRVSSSGSVGLASPCRIQAASA
jgi:hypothetical protein